ncbi:ubiquitin-protein ligase TUL1 [Sugiyamaella lignohabitans]|uniref:RING-type E3 ubiquitin transferase n=1 Tax=Sugiyamaella lignohabitans TaxID=796027 RepID=A0A161HLC3_9ASCO|nr:ubiquitin-protein ligase TUL1 [Sugiyamaella lignohabitans]ANB14097.1 ubiquitin-protein ligase TUL1 [Sugiyamaella lignohabitans]
MTLTPAGNPPKLISPQERAQLEYYFERHNQSLEICQASSWESGYGRLTGLNVSYPGEQMRPGSIIPKIISDKAGLIWNLEGDYKQIDLALLDLKQEEHLENNDFGELSQSDLDDISEQWIKQTDIVDNGNGADSKGPEDKLESEKEKERLELLKADGSSDSDSKKDEKPSDKDRQREKLVKADEKATKSKLRPDSPSKPKERRDSASNSLSKRNAFPYISDFFFPSDKPRKPSSLSDSDSGLTYFTNISASLNGDWKRMDVDLVPIEMPIPSLDPPERANSSLNGHVNYDIYGRPLSGAGSGPGGLDPNQYYIDGVPVKPGNRTEDFGKLRISIKERGSMAFSKSQNSASVKAKNRTRRNQNGYCQGAANSSISWLTIDLTMVDENDDNSNEIRMQGVRIKDGGNFVATTSSLKFAGDYALPHFLLDKSLFADVKAKTLCRMSRMLNRRSNDPYYGILEEAELQAEKCEYIIYGHVHSSGLTKEQLRDVEDELINPLGRPHADVPKLKVSAVLYSPDCGIAMTVDNLEGEKQELYFIRIRRAIMAGIVLLLVQTVFTALQMKDTNTPSTISRVSFYTIGLMAVLDGAICLVALVSTFLDPIALPFMAVAFVSFALTSLFEIRYMVLIYKSQMLEEIADARAQEAVGEGGRFVARADGTIGSVDTPTPAGASATGRAGNAISTTGSNAASDISNSSTTSASTNDSTTRGPILPTTTTPRPPIIEPDERQIVGVIYSRFYFTMLAFVIISITTSSWPAPLRTGYEYLSMSVLFSFWVPQIYRNIMRGSRKSFLWQYIFSTSIIRLLPILYLCLDTNNVISHRYDPVLASVIAGWLWIQILILFTQSTFGPRFFLPSGMLPALYDYHPIITEEDLETGFNFQVDSQENAIALNVDSLEDNKSDTSAKSTESLLHGSHGHQPHHTTTMDCAICMNPVQLLIFPQDQIHNALTPANMLARRRYMVTPCRHIFHTECMEQWMRTRLQCPVCRNPLPPI